MAKLKIAKELFDLFFPVGYIYTSMNSTNPKTLFGYGEWTQITDRFLYCTTKSKTTGGSTTTGSWSGTSGYWSGTSGSHTLTVNEIPKHRHGIKLSVIYNATSHNHSNGSWTENGTYCQEASSIRDFKASSESVCEYVGGGQGHTHSIPSHTHSIPSHTHSQNLPPYMSCYAWYRTA